MSDFRDWSLITWSGGQVTKREKGGGSEVLPLRKGGGKSFSHAEGGAQKVRVVLLCCSLKF